jgi:hypothetical protein
VPHVHRSHYSWEDYLTTCFRQCLILGKAGEYNRITKTLHPMTPIFFFERHHYCPTLVAPPSFKPCPSTYLKLST